MANYLGPNLVTNGLVLCLDAGNTKSYPGSGTTWTNIASSSNNGNLVGSTFNASNGGSIAFNGIDNYVSLGSFFTYQTFTIGLWVNPGTTQTTYADIFDNNHTGSQSFVLQQDGNSTNIYGFGVSDGSGSISSSSNIAVVANAWTHLAFTFSPSSRVIAYVNGAFHSQGALANGRTINYAGQSLALGRWEHLGARYWNGKISNFMVYNQVLTATQIQQNYNAFRGRFGI